MPSEGSCVIGSGITIRGSLSGGEPLIIEGRVEGTIALKNHLTVERGGVVAADVEIEHLTVNGEIQGNIVAEQTVSVSATATVLGNIKAPRVIIDDGARFKGSIEMDFDLPDGIVKGKSR